MRHRLVRRGLLIGAVLAVVLVGTLGYVRLGDTHAQARAGVAAHPIDTFGATQIALGEDTSPSFYPGEWFLYSANAEQDPSQYAVPPFQYGFFRGYHQDPPVVGDWTGKGYDSVGEYVSGTFYLRNSNSGGAADTIFPYGPPSCLPLAGDWTGKGYDSIGAYCYSTGTFYLRNSNTGGNADIVVRFGPTAATNESGFCRPLAGDWTGKGYDSVGVVCEDYMGMVPIFYLRNSNTSGVADIAFTFGPDTSGKQFRGIYVCDPIAGDWIGQGRDTIGVYCPLTDTRGVVYLRNSNSGGNADIAFSVPIGLGLHGVGSLGYGRAVAVAGHWTPPAS